MTRIALVRIVCKIKINLTVIVPAPSRVSEDMVLSGAKEGADAYRGSPAPEIEKVPSSPAAAYAAPDSVIKIPVFVSAACVNASAKTVQELILEAEVQALLHETALKGAASIQRLH